MNRKVLLIFFMFFLFSCILGGYSGGAVSDAGDYTTYAFQLVKKGHVSSLFNTQSERTVLNFWVFLLVLFMKLFGASNLSAIILTSFISTIGLYYFYKIMTHSFKKEGIYILLLYAISNTYLLCSYNASYEAIFICLLLVSVYYYLLFWETFKHKNLIVAAVSGAMTVFVHPTSYFYIGLIWLTFPFFSKQKLNKIDYRTFMLYTTVLWILPVVQIFLWYINLNSIFPYIQLQKKWRFFSDFLPEEYSFRYYINYALYYIFILSPFIFLTNIFVWLDGIKPLKRKTIILLFGAVVIIILFLLGIEKDKISPVALLYGIPFVFVTKSEYIRKNKFLFIAFLIVIFLNITYLRIMPRTSLGIRQHIYFSTFLIPIFWEYGRRLFRAKELFIISLTISIIIVSLGIVFNSDNYNKVKINSNYSTKTFASLLSPALPYNPDNILKKEVVSKIKLEGYTDSTVVMSNYFSRFINANLNLSQDQYLRAVPDLNNEGFSIVSLSLELDRIMENNVKYIVWDKNLHKQSFESVNSKGKRKVPYSFSEFEEAIKEKYDNIYDEKGILLFKKIE